MLFAHPNSGLLLAKISERFWKKDLSLKEQVLIILTFIISSVLPDFDLVIQAFLPNSNHRDFITHTPFLYICISLILLFLIRFVLTKKLRRISYLLVLAFFLGTGLHILTDILAGWIMLFYPISQEKFVLFPLRPLAEHENIVIKYLTTPIHLATEIVFLSSSFVALVISFIRKDVAFLYSSLIMFLLGIVTIGTLYYFHFI